MDSENCLHLKTEDFKPWAYNKVKVYANIPNLDYWYDTGIVEEKYIPLKDIVGTDHYNYGGDPNMEMRWIDVLMGLKHRTYVEEDVLLKQICSVEPPPKVGQFGNEYYIFGGNNRLCKARFLNLATFYCRISKYQFHSDDFNISTRLEKLGFSFIYNPSSIKRYTLIEYNDLIFLLADDETTNIHDFVEAVESIRYSCIDRWIYSLSSEPVTNPTFIFSKDKKVLKTMKRLLYYKGYASK